MIRRRFACVRSVLSASVLGMATAMFAGPTIAADFSGKLIEIVVPFSEGGGTDAWTRFLVPFLKEKLPGQPKAIIRNLPGAGGMSGANQFQHRAKPDGLTVFATSASVNQNYTLQDPRVQYKLHEWIPIVLSPFGYVVYASTSTGIKSPADIAKLRGADNLIYGGDGPTDADITVLLSLDMLGITPKAVFGIATGPARLAFERGELNMRYDTAPNFTQAVKPMIEEGKAVPLYSYGFLNDDGKLVRDPSFPDLPHFAEVYESIHGKEPDGPAFKAWLSLFGVNVMANKALLLPAGTPADIVSAYRDAARALAADPAFRASSERFIGKYELVIGEAAGKILRNVTQMDPQAKSWLSDWLKKKYDVTL